MHLKQCRICQGKQLVKIFSLGKQPLANNLLDKPKQVKEYPLELVQCSQCTLIQLSYVVPKEKMYDTYFYIPSVSKTHLKHFDTLAKKLIIDCQIEENALVVDIGSSDGSLLQCFKKQGMRVCGVEPAQNITSAVVTFRQYFTKALAEELVKTYGKAKLITATNSFAHIDNLTEYLEALEVLLDDNGVFFAQFPNVRNLFQENQFDTIYHEHLSYFSYESLQYLFAHSPFELYHIEESTIHGGSMGIYVRRRQPLVKNFLSSVETIKKELFDSIKFEVFCQDRKVVGFGAAAKGVVLLNACGLNQNLISYVVDGTPYKQGKYIPGVNIPIVPEEELLKEPKSTIVLILAWNFKEEIMEKLKDRGFTFIIPIPKVEVIEP